MEHLERTSEFFLTSEDLSIEDFRELTASFVLDNGQNFSPDTGELVFDRIADHVKTKHDNSTMGNEVCTCELRVVDRRMNGENVHPKDKSRYVILADSLVEFCKRMSESTDGFEDVRKSQNMIHKYFLRQPKTPPIDVNMPHVRLFLSVLKVFSEIETAQPGDGQTMAAD